MKDITAKLPYDNVSVPAPATQVVDNTEYNDRRVELQGVVTDSSQALSASDAGQLSKAIYANAVAAQSMLDSGGVNTVVLTPITGPNGLRVATPISKDYSLLNGAIFHFIAGNTNLGNTTVNIGQTNPAGLIGALKLFMFDGVTEIPAGTLVAGKLFSIMFNPSLDGGNGAFISVTAATMEYVNSLHNVSGRMYLSANQLNLADNVWTLIGLDAIDSDFTDGIEDVGNNRITPGVVGLYSVCVGINFEATSMVVDSQYAIAIARNGTIVSSASQHSSVAGRGLAPSHSDIIWVNNITDYFELQGRINSGVSTGDVRGTQDGTFLTVQRVR